MYALLIECERPTLLRTNNLDGKQHLVGGDEKRGDLLVMEREDTLVSIENTVFPNIVKFNFDIPS